MRKLYAVVSKNRFSGWSRDTDLIFTSRQMAEQFSTAHVEGFLDLVMGIEYDVVVAPVVNSYDTETNSYTYSKPSKKAAKKETKENKKESK